MAYAISGNSVCQVTMEGICFGQVVINTFYYRLDLAGGIVADGGAFLDLFDAALDANLFYDQYRGMLPPQVTLIKSTLQWIDQERYVSRQYGPIGSGTATHVATTANLASVIVLRADIADRRSVGTKHIPGLGGAAVVNGLLSNDHLSVMFNFGDVAIQSVVIGARNMRPIVFGRARPAYTNDDGVVVPAIPKSYREITQYEVQSEARVMTRRTVGRGV